MKVKHIFRNIMLGYIALWIVAIAVISVKLWNVLADYQNDYDIALEASNPDLVMDGLTVMYESDNILSLVTDEFDGLNQYELQSNIDEYVLKYVDGCNVTYKRSDNFSNRKPVYEIYADTYNVGKVVLKQENVSDDFGFHKCEFDYAELYLDDFDVSSVVIETSATDKVYINDICVDENSLQVTLSEDTNLSKKATELTGKSFITKRYEVDGFLCTPSVKIVDQQGEEKQFTILNNNVCSDAQYDESVINEMKSVALIASESYIYNTNQMMPFASVAQYFKPGSNAYAAVQSVQSGLSWAGKPDELEILQSDIVSLVPYSDTVLLAKTYNKVHRLYREVSYEDDMTYEWLWVKENGKWMITDFSLSNQY